jgi:sarcosine oxidase subunit gamma
MAEAAAATRGELARRPVVAGRMAASPGVEIAALPPAARIVLRAPQASLPALGTGLGLALPQAPKTSAVAKPSARRAKTEPGLRVAFWLGPDEWLVIDESGADLVGRCAGAAVLHAAVDVSHRNTAFGVSGPAAADCLNAGCPQDLSLAAFPVGAASRTVLGKAEIVLWRPAEEIFRVECWRSFADYVYTFLTEAARDAAAGGGRS